MKFFRFGQSPLPIKRAALDHMTDVCLSLEEFTQASLATAAEAAVAGTGKLLQALCETGFLVFSTRRPETGGRLCRHYTFREDALIAVVEIASCRISLTVTDLSGKCKLQSNREMNRSLTCFDNLELFLSRVKPSIEKLNGGLAASCVILPERQHSTFGELSADLPEDRDKPTMDLLFAKHWGQAPLMYLTMCESIQAAYRYRCFPCNIDRPLTYIRVSDRFSVFHCETNDTPRCLQTAHLLIDGKHTADDALVNAHTDDGLSDLLCRVVNLAHCCFEADNYFIESEAIHPGIAVLQKLKRTFLFSNVPLPEFYFKHKEAGALAMGASKLCVKELISRHLKASDA